MRSGSYLLHHLKGPIAYSDKCGAKQGLPREVSIAESLLEGTEAGCDVLQGCIHQLCRWLFYSDWTYGSLITHGE